VTRENLVERADAFVAAMANKSHWWVGVRVGVVCVCVQVCVGVCVRKGDTQDHKGGGGESQGK
jgi:hypothetical protein